MDNSLETLRELRSRATPFPENNSIKEWQRHGGKILGYVCIYVPEEILYAAGVLPFRVSGDNEELELKKSEAYLYINTCSFARTGFQLAIEGQYDFLKGLVTAETCDGARRLHDVWLRYRNNNSFMHILYIPRKFTARASQFYRAELDGLREKLGQFAGKEITDEALRHAINIYNRSRQLLHRLYELRKRDNPPITGAETLEVVKAGMRIPREQYNQILEKLVDELEQTDRQTNKKIRLMILGSILHNSEWIKAIESLDALVVTDELCTGTRYFWNMVESDVPPMDALAHYYLNRPPCARFQPSDRRFGHIFDMIDQFKVHGVVSEVVRYCVPYGHDKPLLREKLEKKDIPILELDLEYGQGGTGQISTRAEAFIEMLQTKHFQN